MQNYTTITDLRSDLLDALFANWDGAPTDLDAQIETAISAARDTFSTYGAISERELAALSRAVWSAVMGAGIEYPFAHDDAERIANEAAEDC